MSHVHGHHGNGHHFGHHHLGQQHAKKPEGDQGDKKAGGGAPAAPAAAPAAQAPAPTTQAAQQPSMDTALQALDQAIAGLAANFKVDSFNGQPAPAGVTPTSHLAPVDTSKDVFVPQSVDTAATKNLGNSILDAKGGGGLSGGVISKGAGYLGASGGGGLSGGVINQ